MKFSRIQTTIASLEKYCRLFSSCFVGARHYSVEYLQWLYKDNPEGEVFGFNAYDVDILAAHYACIPIRVMLHEEEKRALLSLNTATHPNYQGRGLFTKLARATYEAAAGEGYECVIGVANANSTPGFIRKLGFQLVSPLEARIGFGVLGVVDWDKVKRMAGTRRLWDQASMDWRVRNPSNLIQICSLREGVSCAWGATHRRGIHVWAELPFESSGTATVHLPWIAPKVFLGMMPSGLCRYPLFWKIPALFRPVPLNFIYRNLQGGSSHLDPDRCLISFLDFDAY